MFVQVLTGQVDSAVDVERQIRRWPTEVGPHADGWLGHTFGVTEDGQMVLMTRFASAEDAARHAARPVQQAWSNELAKLCSDPPTLLDCDDPLLFGGGGSDRAGFVQVITGRTADADGLRAALRDRFDDIAGHRPELLGFTFAATADGRIAEVVYFTDEGAARAGESAPAPSAMAELAARIAEVEDLRFLDLRRPHTSSPVDGLAMPVLHARAVAAFDRAVRAVGPDDWARPTPCSEWDVRALVNHVVVEDLWTPPLLAGQSIADVGTRFDGDVLGEDPAATWADASAAAVEAVGAPGAMEATAHLSFADLPGREYTAQLVLDHTIHSWDLARAVGAPEALDPVLVAACTAIFDDVEELYRGAGVIGEATSAPMAADPAHRLLARLGRTP